MGYAFFGGVAEGAEKSIDRIGQIIDQRVETENNIEAVKQFNDFSVNYEQSLMKAQETYNFEGDFVEKQKVQFNTLKSQVLSGIKNKNVRQKFESLATKAEGDYLSRSAAWETQTKRVKTKQDAMDIQAQGEGAIYEIANNADLETTALEINKQYDTVSVSLAGLSAEQRPAAEQDLKDSFSKAGYLGYTKKLERQYAEGNITLEELTAEQDKLSSFLTSGRLSMSPELTQQLLADSDRLANSYLEKYKTQNEANLKTKATSYLDLRNSAKAPRDLSFEARVLKFAPTEEDKKEWQTKFDLAEEAAAATISVQSGNLNNIQNQLKGLNEQLDNAVSGGDYQKADSIKKQISLIQTATADSIKAFKDDPAGEVLKINSNAQLLKASGDYKGYYNEIASQAATIVGRSRISPLTKAEQEQAVTVLSSGNAQEIGQLLDSFKKWDYSNAPTLTGTSLTPRDILISELSKHLPKEKDGTTTKPSALALLAYGETSTTSADLINTLRTPIVVPKGIERKKIEELIETGLKPYIRAFENQSNVTGGQTHFVAGNRAILNDLALRIASKGGETRSEKDIVNEAFNMTLGKDYVTQNKGGNPITVHKKYATPEYANYLNFLGDKTLQSSYSLEKLFGKNNTWDALRATSETKSTGMMPALAKSLLDKSRDEVLIEAEKQGLNISEKDIDIIQGKDFTQRKTLSKEGLSFIQGKEDLKLEAYPDAGRYSIGRGTISYAGEKITKEEADRRFAKHLEGNIDIVNDIQAERIRRTGKGLSQKQFDALVSFVYNNGEGKMSTLKEYVVNGNDTKAEQQFRAYVNALVKGEMVSIQTLVNRREEESVMYKAGTQELDKVVKLSPEMEKLAGIRETVLKRKYEAEIRKTGVFKPVGNTGTARLYVTYTIPNSNQPYHMPLILGIDGVQVKYLDVTAEEAKNIKPKPPSTVSRSLFLTEDKFSI